MPIHLAKYAYASHQEDEEIPEFFIDSPMIAQMFMMSGERVQFFSLVAVKNKKLVSENNSHN